MTFKELFHYSRRIKSEPSRNGKAALISEYLKKISVDEALYGVDYIAGRLPQGRMNLVWKGLSALLHLPYQSHTPLAIGELNFVLEQVALARGHKKYEILKSTFRRMNEQERQYFLSLIFGEAQQGAGEGVVKQAIAHIFELSDTEIEDAYLHDPDLGKLYSYLLKKGKGAVKHIGIQLFRPVKPMLAQVSESIDATLRELDTAAIEYKLDGVRIQVHRDGDEVKIFSRNLKDRTIHFPELVTLVQYFPVKRFIMDGEAIALDDRGRVVPFQVLAKRTTRKKNIDEIMKDIPVQPQFFDILYIDHDDLTALSYRERYDILLDSIHDPRYQPQRVPVKDPAFAQAFFEEAVEAGNEGVVIKGIDAPYRPGKRGKYWFKIKHTYTVDCVILAAEWGYGRRKGWLSNIHLGVFDATRTKYLMVGKTFKGLTDTMLQWMTDTLPKYRVHEDKWTVYVRPVVVVEIAFNEVQTSPRYDSHVSLRFARVKRFRNDKDARDINTVVDLERMQRAV
jgi:DNA ligase-1